MHSCSDGNRRVLSVLLRVLLVERGADAHVGALRLTRMHLRQEHGARAEVIAADLRRLERFGVAHIGVADDGDVVAEGLERAEAARREIEPAADLRRRPHVLLGAELGGAGRTVHHLDGRQPHLGRGALRKPTRRHHRIEQRQRHVTPIPLSTWRREMCFFEITICSIVSDSGWYRQVEAGRAGLGR